MLNHICLTGRLVRDPELRRTAKGDSVVTVTLACDRDYVPQGAEREADFVDVVCWKNQADFVNSYFTKGNAMCVSGRLQQRKFTDKDGNKRSVHEIQAEHVYFAESKKLSDAIGADKAPGFKVLDDDDETLPF